MHACVRSCVTRGAGGGTGDEVDSLMAQLRELGLNVRGGEDEDEDEEMEEGMDGEAAAWRCPAVSRMKQEAHMLRVPQCRLFSVFPMAGCVAKQQRPV